MKNMYNTIPKSCKLAVNAFSNLTIWLILWVFIHLKDAVLRVYEPPLETQYGLTTVPGL